MAQKSIILASLLSCWMLLPVVQLEFFSPSYEPVSEIGSLSGDVQNWATSIQNYISQVCGATDVSTLTARIICQCFEAFNLFNYRSTCTNDLFQLASDGIKRDITQSLFDTANYTFEKKNGSGIVHTVRNRLSSYFANKKSAAQKLATKVESLYNEFLTSNYTVPSSYELPELPSKVYWDSDVPTTLPKEEFEFAS